MAMAMSGAEEAFIQVSVRKATSGDVVSSRFQSSTACLWMERVLSRMHFRWLLLVLGLAGAVRVRMQENLHDWQAKGPWVRLGSAQQHPGSWLVLSARRVAAS
ncbi:hypothetical protein NDU88_005960 [Pleurodeles waltl]|uniref:Uncharacterized protein n=1 Tax=Pleurodeles waltl TaxID=8319 RepID=A0AAV7PH64_PLEWA|nr:hypothetical protein NDU88_005960 [Pleurodeles waltl]